MVPVVTFLNTMTYSHTQCILELSVANMHDGYTHYQQEMNFFYQLLLRCKACTDCRKQLLSKTRYYYCCILLLRGQYNTVLESTVTSSLVWDSYSHVSCSAC